MRWSMLRTYYIIAPVIKYINNQAFWHIPESIIAMKARECFLPRESWHGKTFYVTDPLWEESTTYDLTQDDAYWTPLYCKRRASP